MTRDRLWPAILSGWVVAALVLTLVSLPQIVHLWFSDPDDPMRLLEVRDWLAGQSWWDVSQHRLWGGAFAMHWSRLVDLPLAASMALLDPMIGPAASTRVALVLVPLLTLLAVMALAATLTRRLAGIEPARLAVLVAPLSVPLLFQLRPMRIDHHGWQIALALAAMAALLARPSARSGAAIGAALATLLTISLEGLPITAVILGVMLLAWVADPTRRPQALAALWSMLGTVVLLHLATRGPGFWAPACDAIAPNWIAALGVAVLGASATLLLPTPSRILRLALLALAGAATLATLIVIAPLCLKGPFGTLDPIVYQLWYRNVLEGMPVWEQRLPMAVMTIAFPTSGLVGGVLAWRASQGEKRVLWTMMLAVALLAFGLSLLVVRTGGTANALAVPGGAWLLHALLTRARAVESPLKRVGATALALVAASPGLVASVPFLAHPRPAAVKEREAAAGARRAWCQNDNREAGDLAHIPAATLFTPLEMTPALLATSRHRAIASGYHRNDLAIRRVLVTFTGAPEQAHRLVRESRADYVAGCPGGNETELYKRVAPNGFWARLERGERFDWLEPVPLQDSPMLVWRVTR
ncbi:hypothetical protein AB2M62_19140 [Sphingomonas sp. MMS12-HWE2-04]|uniref:hypothetical protein n=1 Tax=Sphingomonas sp. MMS12-HWE2-04 TaxID=3234199 RepID=UPI00384B47B7